jgi:hypothetical protein
LLAEVAREHRGASRCPCSSITLGYAAGGIMPRSCATMWIGLVKPTPCSVQPMHGCPQPTGQLPSPASPKPTVEQLAWVSGPLQPSL